MQRIKRRKVVDFIRWTKIASTSSMKTSQKNSKHWPTHTTEIEKLLDEFNDDQLLSMLDAENSSRPSKGPEDAVTADAQGSPAREHSTTKTPPTSLVS